MVVSAVSGIEVTRAGGSPRHNGTLVKKRLSLDRVGANETRWIRNFIFGIYYRPGPQVEEGSLSHWPDLGGAAGLIYRSSTFY